MGLAPPPRLEGVVELLDRPGQPDAEVRGNLRDLERLNRLFGGVGPVLRELDALVEGRDRVPITILDVGTGGGDIPRAICRWARERKAAVRVEALDRNDRVLAAAADWCAAYPEILLRRAEVPPLPYANASFDCVVASLLLHHLSTVEGIHLLREMRRVARRRVIVSDLERSRRARRLAAVTTWLLSRNRLTRHDGPLSVLRGFRIPEMLRMAAEAGADEARVARRPLFRVVLVADVRPSTEGSGA